MNDTQAKIIQNEAFLWSLVYPSFKVSESILGSYSPNDNVSSNSNQVFNWQSTVLEKEELAEVKKQYQKVNQNGFFRKIEGKESIWSEGCEYHLVSDLDLIKEKKSKLSYESYMSVTSNSDFVGVFSRAFNLSKDDTKGFLERMNGLSDKIEVKYILGYLNEAPVCVGGFYKSNDYWYLMNFGTDTEVQSKGFGTDYLSTVTRFLNEPVVFRTVNKKLVESVGPKAGYNVAIKSKMIPLEEC